MSEVKLNLVDAQTTLTGCIHGSVADRCVAALSAEPETITELANALARYQKPDETHGPFASFRRACEVDNRPWDAGLMVIDLAARIVATESSYSQPGPDGEVRYHNGKHATDVSIPYRLPDDWLFVNSFEAYDWARDRHREQRAANPPLDARAVLYGPPLLDHIAKSVQKLHPDILSSQEANNGDELPEALAAELSRIHAEWLMTPREDLRGQAPREVLLAKQDFIDFDLQFRELQWSFLGEGPPCLPQDSHAYRFAGFGIQEWVVYYYLVRHLLWTAASVVWGPSVERLSGTAGITPAVSVHCEFNAQDSSPTVSEGVGPLTQNAIATLDQLKTAWLETPHHDFSGRIPAIIIDNERRRLPIAMGAAEIMIDEDCDLCRMSAMEAEMGFGPTFWHLDGCNMDDEFVFSPYKTIEEWDAEQRRYREFTEQFNREQAEKKRDAMDALEEEFCFEENLAHGENSDDEFKLDWTDQTESDPVDRDTDPVF